MKYNVMEFYTGQIKLKVPVKNSVKQWNRRGPKPIVLIKNTGKSSLISFSYYQWIF